MKRSWLVRTAAISTAALATVCTLSPTAVAANVPPGRIVSLIPSDDEVSQYVGLPVTRPGPPAVRPRLQDHLDERDDCRTLLYNNTDEVWQSDYAAFRTQAWTYQPDQDRMYVSEAVGTFANAAGARDRFNAVFNPNLFNTCSHAVLRGPLINSGIAVELYDFQLKDDVMLWTISSKSYGQYTGYNTVFVAWHLDNVMAIVSVGQPGNPAQAVSRLAGYILDRVG
jgi:PknH-like extracellular domain